MSYLPPESSLTLRASSMLRMMSSLSESVSLRLMRLSSERGLNTDMELSAAAHIPSTFSRRLSGALSDTVTL